MESNDAKTVLDEERLLELKRRLWKIRDYCHRQYLSWEGYDLIDNEVKDILKKIYGDEWQEVW